MTHPSHNSQPMIKIDGAKVKQLRESQGLTQLYVASAVQVTTDTISRWENRKYPSIKRDNAQKLAEALEVPLDAIIEQLDDEPGVLPEEDKSKGPFKRLDTSLKKIWPILILSGTIGTLILLVALFFSTQPTGETISAKRILPRYCTPGQPFPVAIEVSGLTERHKAIILRENLPSQIEILASYPQASSGNSQPGRLKWLSKIDGPTLFVYIAALSGLSEQTASFQGSISIGRHDEETRQTDGEEDVRLSKYHWADSDGDMVISDREILTVYDLFGDIAPLKKDIDLVEEIWLGTGYRWDRTNGTYEILP